MTAQSALPPMFDDVPDLDESDHACLAEVAEVLQRRGKLDRFDLALRHRHFDLNEGEMLIEENDPETRTLTIRPWSASDVPDDVRIRETQWSLSEDGTVASNRCRQGCFVDLRDRHSAKHVFR